MRGLKTATATHMLRSVLGKTPGFCSSMKLAELSKPLMPSMAAAKPNKRARARLMSLGARQFAASRDESSITVQPLTTQRTVRVKM